MCIFHEGGPGQKDSGFFYFIFYFFLIIYMSDHPWSLHVEAHYYHSGVVPINLSETFRTGKLVSRSFILVMEAY